MFRAKMPGPDGGRSFCPVPFRDIPNRRSRAAAREPERAGHKSAKPATGLTQISRQPAKSLALCGQSGPFAALQMAFALLLCAPLSHPFSGLTP